MCGISGAIGFINPLIQDAVMSMNANMRHRGPDNDSIWSSIEYSKTSSSGIVLAHNRLSIIDLSESGSQPMHHESGDVIVYNGEFYNYQEIKSKLLGDECNFQSTSDTEVLLKLLSQKGLDALSYVNGMFAFAFWNSREKVLTLARDRMGIKPLYYIDLDSGKGNKTFLFSSEVRALLSTNLISRIVEPEALQTYLWNGYVSGEMSMIKGIKLLGAGQLLNVDNTGNILNLKSYWELNIGSKRETFEACQKSLYESVERRLVSDVPLGVFLSGGVDSSAIASITSELTKGDIHTFNVGFPEEEYDESKYALEVAKRLKTRHTSVQLTESDFTQNLPAAMSAIDQPTFDAINTFFVSKAVKDAGISVALSGAGGDELFGGYSSFRDVPRMLKLSRFNNFLPDNVIRILQSAIQYVVYGSDTLIKAQVRWGKVYDSIKADGDLLKAFQVSYALFTQDTLAKLHPKLNFHNYGLTEQYLSQLKSKLEGGNLLQKISYIELMTFMTQRLLRDTDVSSMAVSLEVRVPFMDHQFIEKVSGLDSNSRFNPLGFKKFIKDAALTRLPDSIFNRPKSGFVLPFDRWIRNSLKDDIVDTFNDTQLCGDLGLNQAFITRLIDAYNSGSKGLYWSRIWSIYVLLQWCRKYSVRL